MSRVWLLKISVCLLIAISSSYPWLVVSQSTVRTLPGFPGPLPFHLETGYVAVGELNENELFYYFVESEKNPKEDPLVLWLTGGPGCSAWSGFVFEIGPLNFHNVRYNGSVPTLMLRQYSWTKASSIIFLDSPVGTGFSYSRASTDTIGDVKASNEVYQFLRKWLIDHPRFLSNPLYLGGDSYSGLIIPMVVQEMANGIETGQEPILNLKGYVLGNPVTDTRFDKNSVIPFAHGMGLISDELYEIFETYQQVGPQINITVGAMKFLMSTKKNCEGDYTNPSKPECEKDLEAVDTCISRVNRDHILDKAECPFQSPRPKDMVGHRRSLEENSTELLLPDPLPPFGCSRAYGYLLSKFWANDDTVRKALHVRKETVKEWQRCNYDLPYVHELKSSIKYHLNLTTKGYRALIYSGDHDLMVPFLGTQAWIRSLNFSIVDDWRPWFVDGEVAGGAATHGLFRFGDHDTCAKVLMGAHVRRYTRTYSNNLTFATIKGAGHTAPEFKPKESYAMFHRWISHNSL